MQFVRSKSSLFGGEDATNRSAGLLALAVMHRIFWRSRVSIHAHAEAFWLRRHFMQLNSVCVCLPVNVFAARQFLVSNAPMLGRTHLSTWISNETKRRFAVAAASQSLSDSALLREQGPLLSLPPYAARV